LIKNEKISGYLEEEFCTWQNILFPIDENGNKDKRCVPFGVIILVLKEIKKLRPD